jgi:hypothetical protein
MEIIANGIETCDEEARQKLPLVPISKATERADMYTGISRLTILRIQRKRGERNARSPDQLLKSPDKKTRKGTRNVVCG